MIESYGLFEQILLILIGAVVATTLFRRLKLPAILAYLAMGALIGPFAIGLANPSDMALLSELGVVFLLFMLGLEFSLPKMIAMRKTVLGVGSAQVVITSAIFVGMSLFMGMDLNASIVLAGALALSSTAIVTKELMSRQQLGQPHGQLSFGILLFQDIAAVIFLILVPALGVKNDPSSDESLLWPLVQGASLLLLLLILGHKVLPALFNEIARERSDELFVLVALVTAMAAAWITHAAGLSMALGGFLAGMMLGESHFKHQLESDIRPFRDVLLGLFFVTVGMQLDITALIANLHWVILTTLLLLTTKTIVILVIGSVLGYKPNTSLRSGVSLAQGGEFGFALLAVALSYQVIQSDLNAVLVSTIILSMVLTPVLLNNGEKLANRLFPVLSDVESLPSEHLKEDQSKQHEDLAHHVIICGYGRVGQILARFLKQMNIPYLAIDPDPVRIKQAMAAGEPVYYGDAMRIDLLRNVGASRARLIILTLPDANASLNALRAIKREWTSVPVLIRTQDDNQLEQFQVSGAAEVVPEALEGSLMLVSHVLKRLDIPEKTIEQSIKQVRAQRYRMLHDFTHGQPLDSSDEHTESYAVTITENTFACGKTIAQLKLTVPVIELIHKDRSIDKPNPDRTLNNGDTLVLTGSPQDLDTAEARILLG